MSFKNIFYIQNFYVIYVVRFIYIEENKRNAVKNKLDIIYLCVTNHDFTCTSASSQTHTALKAWIVNCSQILCWESWSKFKVLLGKSVHSSCWRSQTCKPLQNKNKWSIYWLKNASNFSVVLLSLCRVRKLSDFIKSILICASKMNEGLMGLDRHE